MGGEHLVFGIEMPWHLAWRKVPSNNQTSMLPNLEQIVVPYVEAVIAQTGSSSCVLAGYSFAGLMAFEAARQLEKRGVKIEMVMLLDTWLKLPPRYLILWNKLQVLWNKFQRRWRKVLNKQEQNRTYESIGLLEKSRLFVRMLARMAKTLSRLTLTYLSSFEDVVRAKPIEISKSDEPYVPTWEEMSRLYFNARRSYTPRSIDSRGALFLARDDAEVHFDVPPTSYICQGWADLFSGGLSIISVSGNHVSMIEDQSHRLLLAREMDEALNRIQTNGQ